MKSIEFFGKEDKEGQCFGVCSQFNVYNSYLVEILEINEFSIAVDIWWEYPAFHNWIQES